MIGAQINLNENPKAAQLKKVTDDLLTPASVSQMDKVAKINHRGIPAEIPRKNMVRQRGCPQLLSISTQLRCVVKAFLMPYLASFSIYAVNFGLEMLPSSPY